ncbi:MAG: zinc-ribbon domain-containing protein, partial [Bradymonadia bacterium]
MKIICPKCGADYNINDSKIPPDGLHIKCPKCLHSFVATREGAASLNASTGSMRAVSVAPVPTPSPIAQTTAGMPKPPMPPGPPPAPPPPPPRAQVGNLPP